MVSQSMGAVSSSVPRCWQVRGRTDTGAGGRTGSPILCPPTGSGTAVGGAPVGDPSRSPMGTATAEQTPRLSEVQGQWDCRFLAHAPATACGGCTVMTEDICTGRAGWPWLTNTFSSQSFLPCQHAHAFTMTVNTPRVIVTRSSHCSCPPRRRRSVPQRTGRGEGASVGTFVSSS